MTAAADKPHLSREHMLDLLKQMIRIRRFEDKCAELYTQEKIRGFLHLYDGEEAVAVGVIPVLEKRDRIVATYREHGHALVRGVPMTAVLAEMYGKQEGCSRGRGGSMHLFDRGHQFLWRQRHRRRRSAAGGRARARRSHAGRRHRHGLLLRRRRRRRRRISRKLESGRAVGAAGAVRVREQSLRHGNGIGAVGIRNRHPAQGGVLPDRLRGCRRHGCGRGRGCRPPGGACGARERQALFPGMPDLSAARAFDVRRPALSRQGRGRSLAPEGADRALPGMAGGQSHDSSGRCAAHRSRDRCRDRRRRSPSPRPGPGSRSSNSPASLMRKVPCQPIGERHAARDDPSRNDRDHLSRRGARGDPRCAAARRPRVSDGRGRRPLRRLLRGEQGTARRVRPGADSRHAAVGIRVYRRRHRRGDGRHASDRRS